MLNKEIKKSIDDCVLCWLATSDSSGLPNVSPKEIFLHYGDEHLLVANIASPQTVKNILENNQVCISFVDIFVQKGFQLKGTAEIIKASHEEFNRLEPLIKKMTGGKYPFASIIKIHVKTSKAILAPKYLLFPETTEKDQIKSALTTYKIDHLKKSILSNGY